ncbi:MAG: BMP family ABC transporter substrate-binding protein, partial [Chloroflexi bacterium]|nr:BMP family ABC transporter substrate-binding protein [Chloroflexota bacterium]
MSARTISIAGVVLLVWVLVVGQLASAVSPVSSPLKASSTPTLVPCAYFPLIHKTWRQIKVGLVTDMGGINDKSYNATAWKGVQKAINELGIHGAYLESRQQSDYTRNMNQFVNQGYDLIIAVGFPMGVDTANVARANPGTKFAIVDYTYPDCWPGAVPGRDCGSDTVIPNVSGLTFSTDQAAFLAGYLAAGMTTTGKVSTFGGIKIPPVTTYMIGFEQGAKYYNQQHDTNVEVLGWVTNPAQPGCGESL